MQSFALYRLPYADTYTKVTSDDAPQVISSIDEIGKQTGYVIAPFKNTDKTPAVILIPKKTETFTVNDISLKNSKINKFIPESHECAAQYKSAFESFHDAVYNKEFTKLVLARNKKVKTIIESYEDMFLRLCVHYPRLMVQLFSTPQTGTWIIATPEILIEGKANAFQTMALAGTMPYHDGVAEWSEKNKREQHVVEKYIENIITPLSSQVVKDGPYTSRAGNLIHLRTDFRFKLAEGITLGNVIKDLHPTPAVCGMPRNQAMEFIVEHESMDRRYYSGFAGPVGINDETHLYVSLRCAELFEGKATLYAGGGIMPDSQCESEWQETEMKMQTILDN